MNSRGAAIALKPTPVLSRGAATECSPGRKPGVGSFWQTSPGGAKDSFAPPGLRSFRNKTPGLRPGLHSVAAPRLNTGVGFSAIGKYAFSLPAYSLLRYVKNVTKGAYVS